jgi:hypothetical protein
MNGCLDLIFILFWLASIAFVARVFWHHKHQPKGQLTPRITRIN